MSGALGGFDPKQTYDAASADYEDAAQDYWAYLALRAVDRLALTAGERVLDVPCGTGFGLVAAAEQVGPTGRVVGLDYADQMLAISARKVAEAGLANVELRTGDMTAIDPPDEPFDALVCSLGVFFALPSPDDWWRIVTGSGLRRTATEIGEEAAALVRRRCDDFIEANGVTAVVSLTRYAVARCG